MKRALFKFGRFFEVHSATPDDEWAVQVDVDLWEQTSDWHFAWAEAPRERDVGRENPGTIVVVERLRPEVSARFNTNNFENTIISLIKSKHRQFIASGLEVTVNGTHLDATNIYLLVGDRIKPGVDTLHFNGTDAPVDVKILVGIGPSSPKDAGWFVICNGRIILEADRRQATGWGIAEEGADRIMIPSFHNQFARFRGIVSFESSDSSRVPWNTTKTDIDQDSPVWQSTFERMIQMMRPVIDFLNELDQDVDHHTRDSSPQYQYVSTVPQVKIDSLTVKSEFAAPNRGDIVQEEPTIKIQYSKPVEEIEFLKEALGVWSAKAVGERTFELILEMQRQ